jgi:hypothetical protein
MLDCGSRLAIVTERTAHELNRIILAANSLLRINALNLLQSVHLSIFYGYVPFLMGRERQDGQRMDAIEVDELAAGQPIEQQYLPLRKVVAVGSGYCIGMTWQGS